MKPSQWMKKTYENYSYRRVKVVVFPTPPTPVDNTIFMPDSFSSKTFDKTDMRKLQMISIVPTVYGPAVLSYLRLSDLLHNEKGLLDVNNATCCASVTFTVLFDGNGLRYADRTNIDNLMLISRSCHPGSHMVVPMAPYLSALLQYAAAPHKDEKSRSSNLALTFVSPQEAGALFPGYDFSDNIELDRYVSRCTIDPKSSFFKSGAGLGKWSDWYIRRLRRNILAMEDCNVEDWSRRAYALSGHAGQEDDGT